MKKRIFTILLALVAISVCAKERTESEKISAALQALGTQAQARALGHTSATDGLKVLDATKRQLTIIGYENGGYAVIANDDMFAPVLGYSDDTFTGEKAPGFIWWLEAMDESLSESLARGCAPERPMPAASYKASVGELLTTKWGQDAPFNNLTPTYIEKNKEEHYVTGCVATALSQIMYYHKYPKKGKGSKSYYFYPEGGGDRVRAFANFGATTYDWDNMLDTYTGSYTSAQATAVATIMSHAGVSVEMSYTKDGSGAFSSKAWAGMQANFLYRDNIKLYYRTYFPIDEWMDVIYRELSDGCPLYYAGQSSSGGHAFVCDGYDADGKVHINWGWDGKSNGYFDIASLNGYKSGQELVTFRLPDDDRYNGPRQSLWCHLGNLSVSKTLNAVKISTSDAIINFFPETFTGDIGALARNMSTGETVALAVINGNITVESKYGFAISQPYTVSVSGLAAGKYRIYLGSKAKDEAEWQPVRSHENLCSSYILEKADNGALTLTADNSGNWTAGLSTGIASAERSGIADGMVRVYTAGGRLVYTGKAENFSPGSIAGSGVFIVKTANGAVKILK